MFAQMCWDEGVGDEHGTETVPEPFLVVFAGHAQQKTHHCVIPHPAKAWTAAASRIRFSHLTRGGKALPNSRWIGQTGGQHMRGV